MLISEYYYLSEAAKGLDCTEDYLKHLAANRNARIHVLTGGRASCGSFYFDEHDRLVEFRKVLPNKCLVPFEFWARREAGEDCQLNSLASIESKNMPDGIGDELYSAPWQDCTGKSIEFSKFVVLRDEFERLKQVIQDRLMLKAENLTPFSLKQNALPDHQVEAELMIQNENPKPQPIAIPADDNFDEKLATLFDAVPKEVLEKMFPANGKWTSWAERASANGLKDARPERKLFNPYRAGLWFVHKGIDGWDLARLHRVLANNLPARSKDEAHNLTGDLR